jgi:hypothetical protein
MVATPAPLGSAPRLPPMRARSPLAERRVERRDQLLDDLLQRVVVQGELPPQHPQGDAAVLLEVAAHLANDLEEIHRGDSSSCAMRSAWPVAPISTKKRWASRSSRSRVASFPTRLASSPRST